MLRVIAIDCFHCFNDFTYRSERQQSCFSAVDFCKACFLGDDRSTCCQITRAAVAEPAGIESDVLILRDSKFTFGALDVIPIKPVIDAHLQRTAQAPAVSLEFSACPWIFDVGCQLKCFASFVRCCNETQKFP